MSAKGSTRAADLLHTCEVCGQKVKSDKKLLAEHKGKDSQLCYGSFRPANNINPFVMPRPKRNLEPFPAGLRNASSGYQWQMLDNFAEPAAPPPAPAPVLIGSNEIPIPGSAPVDLNPGPYDAPEVQYDPMDDYLADDDFLNQLAQLEPPPQMD